MNKIFRYELRRMVFSKFYLGLSAVTIWYGWQILNTTTILGTAHTAPFSPWSFGSYLSQLLPLLCVALLFLVWNQCSNTARRTAVLTTTAAQNPGVYQLVKCGAAAAAWLLLVLLLAALGQIHASLLFPMMALVFGTGFLPLPDSLDLYSGALFSQYPLTLEYLDPAFSMPLSSVAGKCAMVLIGAAAFIYTQRPELFHIHKRNAPWSA